MTLRHFLRDDDLSTHEQLEIFSLAQKLKENPYNAKPFEGPQGVAVLLDKTSTRTRFSFDIGIAQLGGHSMVSYTKDMQIGHAESIGDTARLLSRYTSMIVWRTYAQAGLEELAKYANVPVINALSDEFHPCQVLTDLFTIKEYKGDLTGLSLVYIGDGTNNMAHSLLLGGLIAGMDVTLAIPEALSPNPAILADAQKIAAQNGAGIRIEHDPQYAVVGADVIYTDTWVSMGYDAEKSAHYRALLSDYQVNRALISRAETDVLIMHCLPAHRNEEITDEVMDGENSIIFDQAENRLHVQKALMTWLIQESQN